MQIQQSQKGSVFLCLYNNISLSFYNSAPVPPQALSLCGYCAAKKPPRLALHSFCPFRKRFALRLHCRAIQRARGCSRQVASGFFGFRMQALSLCNAILSQKVSLRLTQRARVDFLTSAPAYVKNQPRNLKPRSFLLWSVFPLSSLALSPFPLSLKLMYAILMRERQGGKPFTAVLG